MRNDIRVVHKAAAQEITKAKEQRHKKKDWCWSKSKKIWEEVKIMGVSKDPDFFDFKKVRGCRVLMKSQTVPTSKRSYTKVCKLQHDRDPHLID
jgi:hypothetical protein